MLARTLMTNKKLPALATLSRLPDDLGSIAKAAADSGYFNKDNSQQFEKADIEPYLPNGRQHHNPMLEEGFTKAPETPKKSLPGSTR
jgi:hypothetical protein